MGLLKKFKKHINNKTLLKKLDCYLCTKLHFCKLIYPFFKLFKINDKKIICDNFKGKDYSDNPKYIIEELHKRCPDYKIYWIFNFFEAKPRGLPDYVIPVQIDSTKELFHLATSKFWIFNYRKYNNCPKRKQQIYFQTWHGAIGPKMIEKDIETHLSKKYLLNAIKDSKTIDYCISGSKHLSHIFEHSFWFNGNILEFGSPRNDILFNPLNISKIKNTLSINDKKICLYAPTFREDHKFTSYNLNYDKILQYLNNTTKDSWIFLVKFHPSIIFESEDFNNPNVINISKYQDSQELLLISDILITDYSSIIFDFCNLYRPAFIYASDYEDYIKNDRNFYFELKDTPFPISQTTEELIHNIDSFNIDDYKIKVNQFLNKMGNLEDGNASKRTVDFILSL